MEEIKIAEETDKLLWSLTASVEDFIFGKSLSITLRFFN